MKKILTAKIISYAEFDEIDRLNKGRFLCKEKADNHRKLAKEITSILS